MSRWAYVGEREQVHEVRLTGSCTLSIVYDQECRQFSLTLRRNPSGAQKRLHQAGATISRTTLQSGLLMGFRRDSQDRCALKAGDTFFSIPEREAAPLGQWLNLLNRLLQAAAVNATRTGAQR